MLEELIIGAFLLTHPTTVRVLIASVQDCNEEGLLCLEMM